MKYIITYEESTNEPQIGDYVICQENYKSREELHEFMSNNVGEVISKNPKQYGFFLDYKFVIKYEDIPKEISLYFVHENLTAMSIEEILYFSSDKEEALKMLPIIKNLSKYNL